MFTKICAITNSCSWQNRTCDIRLPVLATCSRNLYFGSNRKITEIPTLHLSSWVIVYHVWLVRYGRFSCWGRRRPHLCIYVTNLTCAFEQTLALKQFLIFNFIFIVWVQYVVVQVQAIGWRFGDRRGVRKWSTVISKWTQVVVKEYTFSNILREHSRSVTIGYDLIVTLNVRSLEVVPTGDDKNLRATLERAGHRWQFTLQYSKL